MSYLQRSDLSHMFLTTVGVDLFWLWVHVRVFFLTT